MENPNDSAKIISLLEEQNKTLHTLLNVQLLQEKRAFRRMALSFIFHAIPYIIIILLIYFLYQTIHGYLDALNNDITNLNNQFISVKTSIMNIPGSIKDSVQSGLSDLNPFK